jgi:hypothetical protein
MPKLRSILADDRTIDAPSFDCMWGVQWATLLRPRAPRIAVPEPGRKKIPRTIRRMTRVGL